MGCLGCIQQLAEIVGIYPDLAFGIDSYYLARNVQEWRVGLTITQDVP
jgi:hypothetical protein